MKISMLMSVYGQHAIGGAERTAAQIASGLAGLGHQVGLVSLGAAGAARATPVAGAAPLAHVAVPLAQLYDPYGLDGQAAGSRPSSLARAAWHAVDVYNPVMGGRLAALWRRQRPDVVVTHTLQGFSVAAWRAARQAGAAVIHVVHDHALICPNTAMTRGTQACARPCTSCAAFGRARHLVSVTPDAVVGPSQNVLDRHRQFGWFTSVAEQRVIENAIAADWPAVPRPRPASAARALRFGYVGRLDTTKGLDTLLEAASTLPATAFELHIAGSGDAAWVHDFINRHGLAARTRLHGVVQAAPFMQGIDVLVTPSRAHETFCNVVMEAACLGIPAIVSDRGALPERVNHGASGWLFPAGDAQALRRCMQDCLNDRDSVARLGAVALQSRERYEAGRQTQAWNAVCQAVLARRTAQKA